MLRNLGAICARFSKVDKFKTVLQVRGVANAWKEWQMDERSGARQVDLSLSCWKFNEYGRSFL